MAEEPNPADNGASGPSGPTGAEAQTGATGATGAAVAQSGPSGATGPEAPIKYDLKLPEKSALGEKALERAMTFAKEHKLSNDQAQKLLDRDHALHSEFQQAAQDRMHKLQDEWQKTASEDPEYGGEQFGKNAEMAKRVVDKFGSETLKKGLKESGFGDHPELIRLLVKVGNAMSDDAFIHPPQAPPKPRSHEERLYGKKE